MEVLNERPNSGLLGTYIWGCGFGDVDFRDVDFGDMPWSKKVERGSEREDHSYVFFEPAMAKTCSS